MNKIDYFVHHSSFVDEGATIGEGTKIWHFCHVQTGAVIGKRTILGQNVNVSGSAIVGNDVRIQNNVSIYDRVIIEDMVFCGPSCVFTNVINPRAFIQRKDEYRETRISFGASIGANATIVCGVNIGKFAFVGAGSVVTKDIADYSLSYGNPAKHIAWICSCGEKLDNSLICKHCGKEYIKSEDTKSIIQKV